MNEKLKLNVKEIFSESMKEANRLQEEITRLQQIEENIQDLIEKKVKEIKGFERALSYDGIEYVTKDKIRDILKSLKLNVNDLCRRIGKDSMYKD